MPKAPLQVKLDDVRVLEVREVSGGPPAQVELVLKDGEGHELSTLARFWVDEQGFVTGDTPGVDPLYCRVNGSNQIQLAGR